MMRAGTTVLVHAAPLGCEDLKRFIDERGIAARELLRVTGAEVLDLSE